jgi:hypothetical protein
MLASLLVVQQSRVDWTWWRFTILLMMAAAAALGACAWFADPPTAGGRAGLLTAAGAALLGSAIWLGALLRTAGRPLGETAGRVGPAVGLAGAAYATYGLAAGAGVVSAPPDVRAALALAGMSLVLGFGTNAAMLGHGYLTAKAMPIDPLRRLVGGYGLAVLAHGVAAAAISPMIAARFSGRIDPFWLAVGIMYGLVGGLAPLMFAFMAWQAVRVRNTQSTTGIMYFAMVMNFIGALALCFLLRGR